ncbi:MAG TPA: DMT family transporter [Bacillales bacterium]|nr:DMT family transporter [Bacillales bacterium]
MNRWYVADSLLLLVAFIWGATFVIIQNAVTVLEPFTFNGFRFLCAALFLLGWMVCFHRRQLKKINRSLLVSGVIMGSWLFCGYALQTFGLLYTTSSKAGFLTGLNVVLVPLLAFWVLKQKPKKFAVVGVMIAAGGLYMLTAGSQAAVNIGDLLEFLCAIGFAMQIVFTGKYASFFPALVLTLVQISTVAVLNLIAAFLFENWTRAFSAEVVGGTGVWGAIFFTSLFATVLAYLAQTAFQKNTAPTHVALIFTMEPVFAALTAYIWAGERLGTMALIGCLLIFAGMILSELPGKRLTRFKRSKPTISE